MVRLLFVFPANHADPSILISRYLHIGKDDHLITTTFSHRPIRESSFHVIPVEQDKPVKLQELVKMVIIRGLFASKLRDASSSFSSPTMARFISFLLFAVEAESETATADLMTIELERTRSGSIGTYFFIRAIILPLRLWKSSSHAQFSTWRFSAVACG